MALNTYDRSLDTIYGNQAAQVARQGVLIAPDDNTDLDFYSVIVVVAAGDVKFIPVINADNDPITMAGLPAGYTIPWQVRRVLSTGTTATLRTLDKVYGAF